MRWMASEIVRGMTTETVVKGMYRIGGRGANRPLLPHHAIALNSLGRLRTLLGGGLITSGEGGVGGVGELPPAVAIVAEAAVFVRVPSVQAPTVVAARLRRRQRRRRRRRLAPVVAAADDAGMLHVRVMI